jgi:hypothetical protein
MDIDDLGEKMKVIDLMDKTQILYTKINMDIMY